MVSIVAPMNFSSFFNNNSNSYILEASAKKKKTKKKSTKKKKKKTKKKSKNILKFYKYDKYFPIIISYSDNLGNVRRRSFKNSFSCRKNCKEFSKDIVLNPGKFLVAKILAQDPLARPLLYKWTSTSAKFNNTFKDWSSSNEISYMCGENDFVTSPETFSISVSIKSEKEFYRLNGGDDDIIDAVYNVKLSN